MYSYVNKLPNYTKWARSGISKWRSIFFKTIKHTKRHLWNKVGVHVGNNYFLFMPCSQNASLSSAVNNDVSWDNLIRRINSTFTSPIDISTTLKNINWNLHVAWVKAIYFSLKLWVIMILLLYLHRLLVLHYHSKSLYKCFYIFYCFAFMHILNNDDKSHLFVKVSFNCFGCKFRKRVYIY